MIYSHETMNSTSVKIFAGLALLLVALHVGGDEALAQIVGGSARSLASPQKVQNFFDSAAFYLIKTVGLFVSMIALAISIFAAKFGRGSFSNIAGTCFYIALLFLSPSIVQLLSMLTGIGF